MRRIAGGATGAIALAAAGVAAARPAAAPAPPPAPFRPAALVPKPAAALPAATTPPPVGVLDAPCAALPPVPAIVAAYRGAAARVKARGRPLPLPPPAVVQAEALWQQALLISDFPGLCRYQAANAALPAASERRILFFGDSITEYWASAAPDLFQDDRIDRGIAGQSTEQMLGRFRADVIDLHPRLVHIIAGTNDIAGNTGPTALAWIEANIASMVELAAAHHIAVVLGATPPASRFAWRPGLAPAATIVALNRWLRDFAQRNGLGFVDYHAALDDGHGGLRAELTDDGVHPNAAGYAVMTPLARSAIGVPAATGAAAPRVP